MLIERKAYTFIVLYVNNSCDGLMGVVLLSEYEKPPEKHLCNSGGIKGRISISLIFRTSAGGGSGSRFSFELMKSVTYVSISPSAVYSMTE